jgi:predicted phosphodiesterase
VRFAFVSDIHGNLAALEAVHADIRRRSVDQVVCLGDNVSGPLLPRETAQYLMASGWLVLAGNHERQVLEFDAVGGGQSDGYARAQLGAAEMAWIRTLQPTAWLGDDTFLCHGTPRSDCEHFLETIRAGALSLASTAELIDRLSGISAPLVVCGHSHVPRSVRLATGQLLLNPGSVGLQAYVDEEPERYVMQLGTPDGYYAIAERAAQGWQSMHVAVPYAHASMAELAASRGRHDWQRALLRGYI